MVSIAELNLQEDEWGEEGVALDTPKRRKKTKPKTKELVELTKTEQAIYEDAKRDISEDVMGFGNPNHYTEEDASEFEVSEGDDFNPDPW